MTQEVSEARTAFGPSSSTVRRNDNLDATVHLVAEHPVGIRTVFEVKISWEATSQAHGARGFADLGINNFVRAYKPQRQTV
jgi:hypothetical protein